MDTVVVIQEGEKKLPKQLKQFVRDLNWLRDEGYIRMEEVDGVVRIYPA